MFIAYLVIAYLAMLIPTVDGSRERHEALFLLACLLVEVHVNKKRGSTSRRGEGRGRCEKNIGPNN